MTDFIKIQPHVEIEVPSYFHEEREVDVQINYRVSDDGVVYFGPMECNGSIHKNRTMMQLQKKFRDDYEKRYKFVEVTQVFIDKDFLEEYKADAKNKNKGESEKLMKVIHHMLGMSDTHS